MAITPATPSMTPTLAPAAATPLTITPFTPVVTGGASGPATAHLTITAFTPSLVLTVAPAPAALSITVPHCGGQPQLTLTVRPATAALTITPATPTRTVGRTLAPRPAQLRIRTFRPTIAPLPGCLDAAHAYDEATGHVRVYDEPNC